MLHTHPSVLTVCRCHQSPDEIKPCPTVQVGHYLTRIATLFAEVRKQPWALTQNADRQLSNAHSLCTWSSDDVLVIKQAFKVPPHEESDNKSAILEGKRRTLTDPNSPRFACVLCCAVASFLFQHLLGGDLFGDIKFHAPNHRFSFLDELSNKEILRPGKGKTQSRNRRCHCEGCHCEGCHCEGCPCEGLCVGLWVGLWVGLCVLVCVCEGRRKGGREGLDIYLASARQHHLPPLSQGVYRKDVVHYYHHPHL